MPDLFTRADALREYLTGAVSDGGTQTNPSLSLGGFRSSTEALSYGIQVTNPLSGVSVLYASGGNPVGAGTLTAVDAYTLSWLPNGYTSPTPAVFFSGTQTKIVEAPNNPGAYLRITGTTPFTPGASTVTLSLLYDNQFGFDDISIANAGTGISEYRASMVRNESAGAVLSFQRWLATLGTPQVSNAAVLGAGASSGTITTTGGFSDWPETGWCQIQSSGGTLKEVIYYSARTNTSLTVPSAGRGLLGTSPVAGALTDKINPTPGVALGIDPTGVQNFGTSVQSIVSSTTPPTMVSWSLGLTQTTGLQIGNLLTNQQVGIWAWRQAPPGIVATPQALTEFMSAFSAY